MRPILLIEDNPDDVELTQIAFRESKIANPLVVVQDGETARDLLLRHAAQADSIDHPALVLLDLQLPKISGLELLKLIRTTPEINTIPVVILTTSTEVSDLEACYAAGANSFIQKPVDFEQFVWAIRQLGLYWLVLNRPPS